MNEVAHTSDLKVSEWMIEASSDERILVHKCVQDRSLSGTLTDGMVF